MIHTGSARGFYRTFLYLLMPLVAVSAWSQSTPVAPVASDWDREAVEFIGESRAQAAVLRRWLQSTGDRAQSFMGQPLPSEGFFLRVVLGWTTNDYGRVGANQAVRHGRCVQQVLVENYDRVSRGAADEVLASLLLARYVMANTACDESARGTWNATVRELIPSLPRWLIEGMPRNLDVELQAADSYATLQLLLRGDLPTVSAILDEPERLDPGGYTRLKVNPVHGVFVRWLLGSPGGEARLRALSACLGLVTRCSVDRLVPLFEAVDSVEALERAWVAWVRHLEFEVFLPGSVHPVHLDLLWEALLLTPGESGIPVNAELKAGSDVGDLLPWRDAEWMAALLTQKRLRLQRLALGRGEAFVAVIDGYNAYLDALRDGLAPARVAELWRAAQAAAEALRVRMMGTESEMD